MSIPLRTIYSLQITNMNITHKDSLTRCIVTKRFVLLSLSKMLDKYLVDSDLSGKNEETQTTEKPKNSPLLDNDTENGLQNEIPTTKKSTRAFLVLYVTMLLLCIGTGITIGFLRNENCSVDTFLISWLIIQALLIFIGTIAQVLRPRAVTSSLCKRIFNTVDIMLIIWGIIGIIGYIKGYDIDTDIGSCGQLMWHSLLSWSIIPIISIFVLDVYVCTCL